MRAYVQMCMALHVCGRLRKRQKANMDSCLIQSPKRCIDRAEHWTTATAAMCLLATLLRL